MENIKLRDSSEQKDLVIKEGIKEPEGIQPIPEEINEEIVEVDTRIQKNQETITNTTQNIERLRNELGLSGEENMIPSIEPNKIGIEALEDKKKKLPEILKKIISVAKLAKIATLSAGLFIATENNMNAQNNSGNKIDKKETRAEKVSNNEVKAKELEGITVYGIDQSRKELQKQQEDIKKYLEEMNKYKQDSIEWVNANKAYQDSLNLYTNSKNNLDKLNKSFPVDPGDFDPVGPDLFGLNNEFMDKIEKGDMQGWPQEEGYKYNPMINFVDSNGKLQKMTLKEFNILYKNKIKPKFVGRGTYHFDNIKKILTRDFAVLHTKPVAKPVSPKKPESHIIPRVKYDATYEDLRMKSLWANIVKYNPNEKIGTLHPFDPGFEKGFTLDEAINFPQEIKDKFNIDYIYDIVHKNSNNSK